MKKVSGRPGLSHVVNSLNPGGTERIVVEMSCECSQDYDVQVLCLDTPGAWATELRNRGVPVHTLWRQPGFDVSMPAKLRRHFLQHRTRIIHAHQCTPWFYAALSRLSYSEPRLLLHEHGRFYPETENRARIFVNRVLIRRLTHRFVAVSSDIRERLMKYEGLDAAQIEVIHNGVAATAKLTTCERRALRRDLGFSDADFVVGTVGRFDPIKNLPMLVSSLAAAARHLGALRGLLVGDGAEFGKLTAHLARAGLSEQVRLTGYRSDVTRLVQCLDLFVLSSLSEGTSMALLEAMAAGVAVVVTEVGGNPEIVVKDGTGWTVPSGAVEALTAVILDAARNQVRRNRLAQAGQERFKEQFSWARMMAAFRERYAELLAEEA
jgi:glycosyltransferase involved in cell wall biosynthesis